MPTRIGFDLSSIRRLGTMNEDALRRIFHHRELVRNNPEHLAGLLAAKEAFWKALGENPRWLEIEILTDSVGRPTISLSPELSDRIEHVDCSISHDGQYAGAAVLLTLRDHGNA